MSSRFRKSGDGKYACKSLGHRRPGPCERNDKSRIRAACGEDWMEKIVSKLNANCVLIWSIILDVKLIEVVGGSAWESAVCLPTMCRVSLPAITSFHFVRLCRSKVVSCYQASLCVNFHPIYSTLNPITVPRLLSALTAAHQMYPVLFSADGFWDLNAINATLDYLKDLEVKLPGEPKL